ncbi:MAG: alpha-galactosidase [Chloroflexi bacterium]|nr:alpha-galactosidase [Chloroflexota bacterium]
MSQHQRPRLTGARVVGVRPGTPLVHELTANGDRPRTFAAVGLPPGVTLDPATGRLAGRIAERGEHRVQIGVENGTERDTWTLRIVVGDRLALLPPMGWMSWNMFGGEIDETLILQTADALISSGMHNAGYEYVCIDDHWHGGRDAAGRLFPDQRRFPSGIAALADALHDRGLKLGIYSDAGSHTCGGEPGSFGFESQDAQTFASWGVDYLKYDYCHAPPDRDSAMIRYGAMGKALRETDRSIVFAICEWGSRQPWLWGADVGGHLWRTTGDIQDRWTVATQRTESVGIVEALDLQGGLEEHAGRGWHDPDMLLAGLRGIGRESSRIQGSGCTDAEYRSQISLWAILGAPLIASCDLRSMDRTTVEILTEPEIVAIDQDPLGLPGRRVGREGAVDVWARPLEGGRLAVALLNRSAGSVDVRIRSERLGLSGAHLVRDVWGHQPLGTLGTLIDRTLEPHATDVLVCTPTRRS